MYSRLFILAIGLFAATAGLWASPAVQPEFYGDINDTDLDTRETVLRGNARIFYPDTQQGVMEIKADEIRYSLQRGVAVAKGHVILTLESRRVIAEELTYNLKTRAYSVIQPKIGDYPYHFEGSKAEGDRKSLTLFDAVGSYQEPGPWTPTLRADKLRYLNEGPGSFSTEGARLGLGTFKPLPMPSYEHKLDFSLKSYVSLFAGYRGNLGVFGEVGMRLPVASGIRVGGDLGAYSSRGTMIGPSADYAGILENRGEIRGRFRSGYIRDHGERNLDILNKAIPSTRSYATWDHHQRILPEFTLDGSFNYWSDSDVLRDFKRRQFFPVQVPDSYVEAVFNNDNVNLSLLSRFQPNRFHSVQQRLPEVRLDLLPSPLVAGIYQRYALSYAKLREESLEAGKKALKSDRSDAYYGLTRNFTPREWLGLTAVAGTRLTHYSKTLPGSDQDKYTRSLGELGLDAQLMSSGTFNYKNDTWKVDGLRHLLVPKLSYRYVPEAEKGRRYIPSIDRRDFTTYLPQLGLGDLRHVDDLHSMNTLRVAVENTLQTRDSKYGSRDLASLTLANDFRFDRSQGEQRVSETHLDLALMPAPWMKFEIYESFSPYNFSIRELNTGLTIHDGKQWALRVASHYLSGDIAEYVFDYEHRLNEVYAALVRYRYDARRSRFNEQSYGLRHNLSNIWLLRYEISFLDGPRRESSFEFHVEVEAKAF